ncbi:MAG: OmpA family protein [bacterium]|nr:OmpA family protein [bacterium]
MAKKKKEAEHVNLERWMVSYSDFVTLLFATFVVLYALAQVDIKDFEALENSLRAAFAAPSILQGSEGMMDEKGSKDLFDSAQGDAMVAPLMMEYMNPKYEDRSMDEMEKEINTAAKEGELEGIKAEKTERGLLISFKDDMLFARGSAKINDTAKAKIDKVGVIIAKKFILHNMRVEGHTDSDPIKSIFPSNWELSSARASALTVYLINRFKFMPSLFTVVGYAETRPVAPNDSEQNKAKNRRVEILILKNRFKSSEKPVEDIKKLSKAEQDKLQQERMITINKIGELSEAAKKLANGDKEAEANAIILNKVYNSEMKRISTETQALDKTKRKEITGEGDWLRPRANEDLIFNNK